MSLQVSGFDLENIFSHSVIMEFHRLAEDHSDRRYILWHLNIYVFTIKLGSLKTYIMSLVPSLGLIEDFI